MEIYKILASEFSLTQEHSKNIINLIDEGCTIPFIARYRKEMTGSCDDQVLREFFDRLNYLRNLNKRKEEVEKSIKEQEKWTEELSVALANAKTLTEVEDIYRPYKPKRKTRASVAIEKGLKPLAEILLAQKCDNFEECAKTFVGDKVENLEEAIKGAKDIVAEMISDDAELRKELRQTIHEKATIKCELLENENSKTYEMYKNFSQEVKTIPSHRVLDCQRTMQGRRQFCSAYKH